MSKDDISGAGPRRQPPGAVLRLACLAGPEKGREFPLTRTVTVIGRQATCDIVLSDTAVSREHARVERQDDKWILVNLSQNGTQLNDKEIDRVEISDGDAIRVGASTVLKVVAEASADSGESVTGVVRHRRSLREIEAEPEEPLERITTTREFWLRKRKILIGLAVWFGFIFLIFIILALSGDSTQEEVVPFKSLEEIDKAIDVDIVHPQNPYLAEEKLQEGLRLYDLRLQADDNLFLAVRAFQESLAYSGHISFDDRQHRAIYKSAKDELVRKVWETYSTAVWRQRDGRNKQAKELFRKVQNLVPDKNNPVFRKVNEHLGQL